MVCCAQGETLDNQECNNGQNCGYFRHIRGDLSANGPECEGVTGTANRADCVATSSFSSGGIDPATGTARGTVYQNTFLVDGYVASACDWVNGERNCAADGNCRDAAVIGGDALDLVSVEGKMCAQTFKVRHVAISILF